MSIMRAIFAFTVSMAPMSVVAAEIIVDATGAAFKGGPTFELKLGNAVIGSGTVDPIPPQGQAQSFTFDIPDNVLAANERFSIHLTNDLYEQGVGDRNLQVVGLTVAGRKVAPGAFFYEAGGKPAKNSGGFLVGNTTMMIADAPKDGWLPEDKPAETEVALAPPAVKCPAPLKLTGFANGSLDMSAESQKAIEALLDTTVIKSCNFVATGYSSLAGPADLNLTVATARAQSVADALKKSGIDEVRVVAFGETDQFGPRPADNRVVVIEATSK